jgi:hypothetical protein
MKRVTLTPSQQRVVDRMREGWELGKGMGGDGSFWLQRNGLGRGGENETVHASTAHALYTRGVIEVARDRYPFQYWRLTPTWKMRNGIPKL